MIIEERAPSLRRWFAVSDHVLGDGGLGDAESEPQELAVNPWRAPEGIGAAHIADEPAHVRVAVTAETIRSRRRRPV